MKTVSGMLYCFDLDGTLISSYLDQPTKDFFTWHLLDGRASKIAGLVADGHKVAIVTNQAGVAFTWKDQPAITERDVWDKIAAVIMALDLATDTPVAVCFAHQASRDPHYSDPRQVRRRKPCGAMIHEVMRRVGLEPRSPGDRGQVVMIGDAHLVKGQPVQTDLEAAEDARVGYQDAVDFFGDAPRQDNLDWL